MNLFNIFFYDVEVNVKSPLIKWWRNVNKDEDWLAVARVLGHVIHGIY